MNKFIINKNKTKNILIIYFLIIILIITNLNLNVKAADVSVTITGMQYDDHRGIIFNIEGNGAGYCIERGYPFKSLVSDVNMAKVNGKTLLAWANAKEKFVGWGKWKVTEGDHTLVDHATYVEGGVLDDKIPSSGTLTDDNESSDPDDSDSGSGRGLEGTKELYAPTMKQVTSDKTQFFSSESKINALALINYYIGSADETHNKTSQALIWAVQYGFIDSTNDGNNIQMIFKNSQGSYRGEDGKVQQTSTESCDSYVQRYIGSDYEAMKLYREFVWKMTNIRTIPSFAYSNYPAAKANPIHLKWNDSEQKYVAYVNDENGVLDWYLGDLANTIPGVTIEKQTDGSLKLSSTTAIDNTNTESIETKDNVLRSADGTIQKDTVERVLADGTVKTIDVVKSTMRDSILPANCQFKTPVFWKWSLEGESKDFTYTKLVEDKEDGTMKHSHDYDPACEWKCTKDSGAITDCTGSHNNCQDYDKNCADCLHCEKTYNIHVHDNCQKKYTCTKCGATSHPAGSQCTGTFTQDAGYACNNSPNNQHDCTASCSTHLEACKHYKNCNSYDGNTTASKTKKDPKSACTVDWTCDKTHYKAKTDTVTATFVDWQDVSTYSSGGKTLTDPLYAYIAVTTDAHDFESETKVDIKLIDQDGDEVNYIIPGEKYKVRYVFEYFGDSKGFVIKPKNDVAAKYYEYYYVSKMYATAYNNNLKTYPYSNVTATTINQFKLDINNTPITMYGTYKTGETPYATGGLYTFDSGSLWNDSIVLDALDVETDANYNDNYDYYKNKSESEILETSSHKNEYYGSYEGFNPEEVADKDEYRVVKVKKSNNKITVTWTYDTEYEVFTSAYINANAYIQVGEDKNYVTTYYDDKYNYGEYDNHNYVGMIGVWSSVKNGKVIATKNSEYPSYAVKNSIWKADIDIKASNTVLNTGAGITQHIYSDVGIAAHNVNFNLYYTINLEHPKASYYWYTVNKKNGEEKTTASGSETYPEYSQEKLEFDVNTLIDWNSNGVLDYLNDESSEMVTVDHIKSGKTYIQRMINASLKVLTDNNSITNVNVNVKPNYDALIYEDKATEPVYTENGLASKITDTISNTWYTNNGEDGSSSDTIYPAMNPKVAKPVNIQNTNSYGATSSFSIQLSNGNNKTIYDRLTKNYTSYQFTFNNGRTVRDNKILFPERRTSVSMFKYSNTNYKYNSKSVRSIDSEYKTNEGQSQTEKYYISEVLFTSNYINKYQETLEKDGASFLIEDIDGKKVAWVDMVNQNKYAIVSAGQGFELKVTVKYENSFLTQYLARYFGYNDGQHYLTGNSKDLGPQYCNISSMTGFEENHAYINGYNTVDRCVNKLITGSNVYKDLYAYMSDNPNSVYSATGMYDTPIIFERDKIEYSDDFSVTTITYNMKKSTENGISSSFQNMKFYTNQLAPDSETPGIIMGGNLQEGKHSITLWTPIVAATPFDYPETIQDRYIGDAIELGYTIKTTGADDSIVHIVQ